MNKKHASILACLALTVITVSSLESRKIWIIWDDPNASILTVSNVYIVSVRLGTNWVIMGTTTNKYFPVTVVPGVMTFGVQTSNTVWQAASEMTTVTTSAMSLAPTNVRISLTLTNAP